MKLRRQTQLILLVVGGSLLGYTIACIQQQAKPTAAQANGQDSELNQAPAAGEDAELEVDSSTVAAGEKSKAGDALAQADIPLPVGQGGKPIIHDAEFYILHAQNGEKWAAEDKDLDAKLAALRAKNDGRPPNIIHILWDDMTFGAVGFPALQKNFGFETPNLNRMAKEGLNFTRMYTEPSCTPTRVAFLTGRHPVRCGMGVVGMPHEMAGLRADEVTIAEVLSGAGYATAHFGKGHLGDIEESYPHNQGFDEALFTPMIQIISQWNRTGDAVGAARGFARENYPPDPYQLDEPGLIPTGLVMAIEGRKGEQGKEWGSPTVESYREMDPECEKRTLARMPRQTSRSSSNTGRISSRSFRLTHRRRPRPARWSPRRCKCSTLSWEN